jgi:hypothetical protein
MQKTNCFECINFIKVCTDKTDNCSDFELNTNCTESDIIAEQLIDEIRDRKAEEN